MAVDCKFYTYRIRWSEEDGEYLATVAEFPSLSWLEGDMQDALTGIISLVDEVVRDLEGSGEPVPEPLSTRTYSGNVRLRIPPEQHRELTIQAAEEGVSLNRLLCSLISRQSRTRLIGAQGEADYAKDSLAYGNRRKHTAVLSVKTNKSRQQGHFQVLAGGTSLTASEPGRFGNRHALDWQEQEEM